MYHFPTTHRKHTYLRDLFSSLGFSAGHLPTALTRFRQHNCGRHSTTHF